MKKHTLFLVIFFLSWINGYSQTATNLKVIKHSEDEFKNRTSDYNNYIGVQFSKTLDIINVDNTPFTGYIKLTQNNGTSLSVTMRMTTLVTSPTTVSLIGFNPSYANGNDIILPAGNPAGLAMTAGQNNEIIVRVENFVPNVSKISIEQDVTITGCLAANNASSLLVSMVQTNSLTLPLAADYKFIDGADYSTGTTDPRLNQVINQAPIPIHIVTDYSPSHTIGVTTASGGPTPPLLVASDFYCSKNESKAQTMKFSFRLSEEQQFQGATFHDFVLLVVNNDIDKGLNPTLFSIDQSSIKIEKHSNDPDNHIISGWSQPTPIDVMPRASDPTSDDCLDATKKFDQLKYRLGDLGPNEHYEIQYDLYNCCKKTDLFDNRIDQSNDFFWYSFKDDCGQPQGLNGTALLGPNTYDVGAKGITMKADINSSPSHLLGIYPNKSFADLGNYVIDNPISAQQYNPFNGGVGAIYNEQEAELIIRVKSGPTLRYVTTLSSPVHGTYDFTGNPGHFSYHNSIAFMDKYTSGKVWNPIDPLGTVYSTVPNGYETREFRFKLTDMPGVTSSSTKQDIVNLFLANMNGMQLAFSMEAVCDPRDDGNWEVQYLFKTSNCSECALPITKVSDLTDVMCPGCKVPGGAVRGNAQRATYGPFDPDNDDVLVAPETESSVHTLSEVLAYNSSNTDASDDIETTIASVNDDIVFNNKFYLTSPSDCAPSGTRIACRDYELQYQWAYLQVKVPKSYLDPAIQGLTVKFQRSGTSTYALVTPYQVTYYTGSSTHDIFYIKIKAADMSYPYFLSADAFDITFNSRVIKNVAERERWEIQYMGYFTQAEEDITLLQTTLPDLYNRSYADCSSGDIGMTSSACSTDKFQMICETWGSYLTFISINTNLWGIDHTLYTQNKSCLKYSKANSINTAPGEKSNYGNPNGFSGLNLFKNEFRKAPLIKTLTLAVPEGYSFNDLSIETRYGQTDAQSERLVFKAGDLSSADQAINGAVGSGRLITIDLQPYYSIINGTANPAKPLHYSDECFQPLTFNITLLADCKYLAAGGLTETDMGNVVISGSKIYSTATFDNPFVGNPKLDGSSPGGIFVIGGDGAITRSPLYNTSVKKFDLIKHNAEGNTFSAKTTAFVNEFDFRQNYNVPTQTDDYDGKVFFAVNKAQISQYFSTFKVEVDGEVVIDVSPSSAKYAGIYPYALYRPIKVSGTLNLSNIQDCNLVTQTALYDLIYGIHCKDNDILVTSTVNGISTTELSTGLCNQWSEPIQINIGAADMLLNTDVTPSYPILSTNKITHKAIFTATRSKINALDILLTNTPTSTITIKSVELVKNNGGTLTVLPLIAGTNYNVSSDQSLINIYGFPDGTVFESFDLTDNYYNEVHVVFDVFSTDCTVDKIKTTIKGTATPFYSSTQCKIVRSQMVEAPLTNPSKPTVVISGETLWCSREPLVLTATATPAQSTGTTYTWYKIVNGNKQLLSGPSAANTYTYNDLTEETFFEVDLKTAAGCIASSNILDVKLLPADQCCTYKLGDITLNCSTSAQNICVPLTAVRNVPAGIIGMDFCLKYDPTVMTYTGPTGANASIFSTVVTNNGLFGASYATYNDAVNGVLRVSIYYTGTGVGLASFKGNGQIVCLNFSVPNSVSHSGVFPITMCTVNDLQEAYTLEEKAACWKAGSLTIQSPNVAMGRLQNPLYANTILGNLLIPGGPAVATTGVAIVGADCDPTNLQLITRLAGSTFSVPLTGSNTKIKITRDIHAEFTQPRQQYQLIVNGSDTWKIHRMTTMDPILNQNVATDEQRNLYWYAITAADVNMNGHIRANDISLLQERISAKRDYFPQAWNGGLASSSLDWRFVDQTTVLANASFKKSTTYPNFDGNGFYRENVPNIPLCLDAKRTCDGQTPELYYGIMLGDVYKSTAGQKPGTNAYLRTSSEPSSITIDAKHSQYLGDNIYRVPVLHKYAYEYNDNLFAIDMYMDYNQEKIRVNNVLYTSVTAAGGTSMMWNNADEDEFILTSYATLDSIAGTGISYYLDIEKYTDEPFKKTDFGTLQFLLNGELVDAKIETGETVTGTTETQSSIKPHVTVIPNPASGDAMIDFAVSNNSNNNSIIITDVLGRMVKSFEHVQNFGMLDFNTNDLAAGMYIITLKGENGFGLSDKFQVRK